MRRVAILGCAGLVLAACSSGGGSRPSASPPAEAPSASAGSSSSATSAADWPMYHGDAAHDGYAASMPSVTGAEMRTNLKLDGEVFASPIVVDGRTIVATENDIVYSLDGDYREQWKVDLGDPSPSEERQCGDITPLGITGTPIYDAGTRSVFLVAEQAGDVRHELYALNPANGAVRWKRTVDPSDWAENNKGDVGLGSQGVALVGTKWAVLGGKSGPVYGLDPSSGKTREKVSVGETSRFATPAIHGRDVLVPTLSGLAVVRTS